MRYMGLLRTGQSAAVLSSGELLEKMGKFMEEAGGIPVAVEGVLPAGQGARVRLADGQVTVTCSPPSEEPAVTCAMFEVKSLAEAIEWTASFLWAVGEGECELRPV